MSERPCYCHSNEKRRAGCSVSRSNRTRRDLGLTYVDMQLGCRGSALIYGDVQLTVNAYFNSDLDMLAICVYVERYPYQLELRWYRRLEGID